ncbi:MAG: replication-associated recombination protein A [Cardiobacteriaceae bacterium]|nr:replication-associated recombination protein A [Cardiobacteriaceae bacterium]
MQEQISLFSNRSRPLAEEMRPKKFCEYLGQEHLTEKNSAISAAIAKNRPFSMLLWGPAGSGKTTLALLLAREFDADFVSLSAVFSGVKDLREEINKAKEKRRFGRRTLLFIDEIHRFNKAQQDAFLPFVEDGTVILIGATTENPAFNINNALLSRLRTFRLNPLTKEHIAAVIEQALDKLGKTSLLSEEIIEKIAIYSDGDARKALNRLEELLITISDKISPDAAIDRILSDQPKIFDHNGDYFYEVLSAFHKSLRGSNADAAMYWFARMVNAGADPLIICRRMLCVASEDISNADPNALTVALNAYQAFERLGAPEGYLAIAQAIVYLALAPKSNSSYLAMKKAFAAVEENPYSAVPKHLCNAPTRIHKNEGYGENYRYAHDEEFAYAAGQTYLPEELNGTVFYEPNSRGFEKKFAEKLAKLRALDQEWLVSQK